MDLVGLETNKVNAAWMAGGFTGPVVFSPERPPHYTVTSQSIAPGENILCSSGITVFGAP